jgi:hypothetical protein
VSLRVQAHDKDCNVVSQWEPKILKPLKTYSRGLYRGWKIKYVPKGNGPYKWIATTPVEKSEGGFESMDRIDARTKKSLFASIDKAGSV